MILKHNDIKCNRSWCDIDCKPEHFNLKEIDSIDYSSGCYEFDYRKVWQDVNTNLLYSARDSGCSCQPPFEDYKDGSEIERLTSITELEDEYKKSLEDKYSNNVSPQDWQRFRINIEQALSTVR